MGKKVNLLFLFTFLLMFSFVSAEKITITEISFPEGFTILEAQQEYLQTNHNFTYNFFLYNTSDGEIKTSDDGVECCMFIANSYGEILLNESVNSNINQGYWYLEIDKSVFSYSGEYSYGVSCHNGVGGALAGTFNSNYTGKEFTMEEFAVYIIVLLNLIGLIVATIIVYPHLPKDETNEEGDYVSINNLTFLRNVALAFIWIMIVCITFIISNLAIAYTNNVMIGNFIFGIWQIMLYSNILIIPLAFIFTLTDILKKGKIKEQLEHGVLQF